MSDFKIYQKEINRICQKYRVKSLTVFGSALSDRFDDSSDIDFLLELIDAKNGIKRYMNIKFELEGLFARPVLTLLNSVFSESIDLSILSLVS